MDTNGTNETLLLAGDLRARVARLATADAEGRPYVVPVCFASAGDLIYIALDAKPKSVAPTRLKRVRNILANPYVSFLVDSYSEDWSRLSYVQVSGTAALTEVGSAQHAEAIPLLREKYPQYLSMPIEREPVIVITATSVRRWRGSPTAGAAQSDGDGSGREDRGDLDFAALARGRHVVRRFKPDLVPRELVEATIEAARWAPSPHGTQPWRFVVLTQSALKEKLSNAMADEWRRNLAMDGGDAAAIEARARASHARIMNTPVLIIPCMYMADLQVYPDEQRQAAEVTMAVQSLGAAIQNMLLSAYSMGLDTGWMCAPVFCPEVVAEALGLSRGLTPHALIQMGWGAVDPPRRPHRPVDELIVMYE